MICSPDLDHEDVEQIAIGYAQRSATVAASLIAQFDALLADRRTTFAARTLATLISTGSLEIKIAERRDRRGIYHEKIGVFSDGLGNEVSFKGSTNETWSGWALRRWLPPAVEYRTWPMAELPSSLAITGSVKTSATWPMPRNERSIRPSLATMH